MFNSEHAQMHWSYSLENNAWKDATKTSGIAHSSNCSLGPGDSYTSLWAYIILKKKKDQLSMMENIETKESKIWSTSPNKIPQWEKCVQ